jgi:uncharacterized membrane protein YcaP (DUF421 family)
MAVQNFALEIVESAATMVKVAALLVNVAATMAIVAALFLKNTKNNSFLNKKSVIVTSKARTFELKWAIVAVLP